MAVLAYPELSAEGYARIQAIRRKHDPRVALIEPHFTIVFPRKDIDAARLIAHVGPLTHAQKPVRFTLSRAETARGLSDGMSYLYLVPDEGHDAIVALHHRLHTGHLAQCPRNTPPFVPHVTVGVFGEPEDALAGAMTVNGDGLRIHGRLTALSVVSTDGATAMPLADVLLSA